MADTTDRRQEVGVSNDRKAKANQASSWVVGVALLGLALLACFPSAAPAAPGDLDLSFGVGGTVSTDFGLGAEDNSRDVAVDVSGRIVVVGNAEIEGFESSVAVARYTTGGTLDPTFGGGDGLVLMHFSAEPWDDAAAVAIDVGGRIVIAGSAKSDLACNGSCDFAVARLTTSGAPDPAFGGGDGRVTTDLGPNDLGAFDLAIDSGGRIVIGGASGGDFAVLRYTNSGALDSSFDGNGVATTDFDGNADYIAGLALDSGGRIVASGYSGSAGGDFAVARYLDNGTPDPSFSGDGRVSTDLFSLEGLDSLDFAEGESVDSHNRIVVAGSSVPPGETTGHLTIVRYTPSGALDSTFGFSGVVMAGTESAAHGIASDDSGRLLAVGYSSSIAGGGDVLIRYLPDGSLDPTFGGDGVAEVPFSATAVMTDPAQRIVVGGGSFAADLDFAVARFLGEAVPSPPPSAPTGAPSTPTRPATPSTRLGKATIDPTRRVAVFRFSGQSVVRFQCALDRKPYTACHSPRTYRNLKPGWHVFRVRASGPGGVDPTPARRRFRIKP